MKNNIRIGDIKVYERDIAIDDVAAFHGDVVHPVCATFTLARDIEWTTRLFMLDIIEEDEEGVGTFLTIQHQSPAFVGETLIIEAVVNSLKKNELICDYKAIVGNRIVATGQTGQKLLKKERIEQLFTKLNNE